jgi:hypothetical protein
LPSSRLVAAPPEKPEIAEAMPAEWGATAADQLLAFTCRWREAVTCALPYPSILAKLPAPGRCGGAPSEIRRLHEDFREQYLRAQR